MRKQLHYIFLFILNILYLSTAYADGSKDFYPSGVLGNRAYLLSRAPGFGEFSNYGRHFVYAKVGETIAAASSAQGLDQGRTILYSPSGLQYINSDANIGRIDANNGLTTRQAELAGPRVGYNAFEKIVDEEGIWTVEFISPRGSQYQNGDVLNVYANDNWTQRLNENLIAAWDVSVRDVTNSSWITGRVFSNVINLHISSSSITQSHRSFYAQNYVLTKDGYLYKVNGNGSVGIRFTYFVNNSGFLDALGNPSYKSSNAGFNANIHDPNSTDTDKYITHKIFYSIPAADLPTNSKGAFGTTWLLNNIDIPKVSNIHLGGSEATLKNINIRGSNIYFDTNYAGRYKVVVRSKDPNVIFTQKEIIVHAIDGTNTVFWDGRDDAGNILPHGEFDVEVAVAAIEGEVHFPYFDMEINPNGLLLERINRDGTVDGPAIVYWDDSELTPGVFEEQSDPLTNIEGVSSYVNGHRWGTYSSSSGSGNTGKGAFSFGNDRAMDTWSYSVQIEEQLVKNINVRHADLEVVTVTADKTKIELNEEVNYTIKLKNNGPSDVEGASFQYQLPLGFVISNVQFQSNCGTMTNVTNNQNTVTSTVDLKSGCELIILLKTSISVATDDVYGVVNGEAGIVRPAGYTDPDATNIDRINTTPGTAREECGGTGCNNIKINNSVFLLEPYDERGQLSLVKSVKYIDTNGNQFQEVGEELEYTFVFKNIGKVDIKDIVLIDSLLSSTAISIVNSVLSPGQQLIFVRRYMITRTDLNRKFVLNTAVGKAKNPRGFDILDISGLTETDDLPTRIAIDEQSVITLVKSISNKGTGENGQFTIGDIVKYKFTARHKKGVPLNGLQLLDLNISPAVIPLNGILNNDSLKFILEYTITASDIVNRMVVNTATISGRDVNEARLIQDVSGTTEDNDLPTRLDLAIAASAKADYFELYQGNSMTFDVLKNDSIGSSSFHTSGIEIVVQPQKGTLKINGNKVVYSPNSNLETGNDSFIYRVLDNSKLYSNEAKVDILIKHTVPVAVDDAYDLKYNSYITLTPSENDYVDYALLDFASVRVVTYPMYGQLLNENGRITYTPDKNYSGYDEFQYVIADRNGNWSDPAIVKFESKGFFIPNVVTPNSDGKNDIFKIIGIYYFDVVELQIFDRFGKSIYYSADYKNDWVIDASLSQGTYYYIFKGRKAGENEVVKKGSLLINRTRF